MSKQPNKRRLSRTGAVKEVRKPPLSAALADSEQGAGSTDTWRRILRIFRFRLLKTRLIQPAARLTEDDLKIEGPNAAAFLALLAEIRERGNTKHPPRAQELAYALGMKNPSQLSELVKPLVANGLCTEERCKTDRREWHYAITDNGEQNLGKWLERELGLDRKYYSGARSEDVDGVIADLGGEIWERLKVLGILA